MSNSYFLLILLPVGICSLVWSHMFRELYVPTGTCLVYSPVSDDMKRMEKALQLQHAGTASAEGWWRNEADSLKEGCVSTNLVCARLPQDMASRSCVLFNLASRSGMKQWKHNGVTVPRESALLHLLPLSFWLLSPVEGAAPIQEHKALPWHTGPHAVAAPCLTWPSKSSKLKQNPKTWIL